MKKKMLFFGFLALVGGMITSCSDSEDEIAYADYTVEENKQNMEDEGLAIIEELQGVKDLKSVNTVIDLLTLLNSESSSVGTAVSKLLAPIAGMKQNVYSIAQYRSTNASIDNLSDVFELYAGTYTYNSTTNSFDYAENSDAIVYIFPIGESTTNNGTLTIDNYTCKIAENADFEGEELPKSLDIELKEGTTTLFNMSLSATYNSEDIFSAENITFSFSEGYSFTQSISNNKSTVTFNLAFSNGGKDLMKAQFPTKGTYDYDNVKTFMEGESQLEGLLNTASGYIQLGNIKLSGSVNYSSYVSAYNENFDEETEGTKDDYDKLCEILNKNISIVLSYADQNTAIAVSQFETEEYTDQSYNSDNNQYETYTGYSLSMSMLFKNGTALDDSFFDEGFEDLYESYTTFLSELQSSY